MLKPVLCALARLLWKRKALFDFALTCIFSLPHCFPWPKKWLCGLRHSCHLLQEFSMPSLMDFFWSLKTVGLSSFGLNKPKMLKSWFDQLWIYFSDFSYFVDFHAEVGIFCNLLVRWFALVVFCCTISFIIFPFTN